MVKSRKYIYLAIFVFVFVVLCVAFYLLFTGPRMREQPKLMAYEAEFKLPPIGTVPVNDVPVLPAETSINPLSPTRENIERGKVYYSYYCVFCHGYYGKGDGPVGDSYIPRPSNLHSQTIQSYQDGKLFRAMLTGTGHSPVLERVVLPDHRWYIVTFVRSLKPDSTR